MLRKSLAAVALVTSLSAQGQVFIVDANNGPGADYTSVETAVAAVPDGSTLRVRPGRYVAFSSGGKALSILGEPNVVFVPNFFISHAVRIQNLPAQRVFTLKDVELAGPLLYVEDCSGHVLLDGVQFDDSQSQLGSPGPRVTNSTQVSVSRCTLSGSPSLLVIGSEVTVHSSRLIGRSGFQTHGFAPARPGLEITQSEVLLATTDVIGGSGLINNYVPSPAILATNSTLRFGGDVVIRAGTAEPTPTSAISATGTVLLEHDPAVQLIPHDGAPAVAGTTPFSVPIPTLVALGAPVGGTVSVELSGQPGDAFFVFVSQTAAPFAFPALHGSVWINLGTSIVPASGTLDAQGQFSLSVPVPQDIRIFARSFAWQAVAGNGTSGFRLSNSVLYTHD